MLSEKQIKGLTEYWIKSSKEDLKTVEGIMEKDTQDAYFGVICFLKKY
jgi:hypothetical protein